MEKQNEYSIGYIDHIDRCLDPFRTQALPANTSRSEAFARCKELNKNLEGGAYVVLSPKGKILKE